VSAELAVSEEKRSAAEAACLAAEAACTEVTAAEKVARAAAISRAEEQSMIVGAILADAGLPQELRDGLLAGAYTRPLFSST